MQEIGFYRKSFTLDDSWKKREIFIHFGAAKAALEVFVNGTFVGYSQGSMTPHEFDISKYVKFGEEISFAPRYTDIRTALILRIRICGGFAAFTERFIFLPKALFAFVIFLQNKAG